MNTKNNKSVNLSSRIDYFLYQELQDEAKKRGISLNSLVNSIAKHYVTWKRYADEIGFVPVTKRLVGKLFKHLEDAEIEKIANELGGAVPRELLFLTYNKMSFENLMQILEINAQRFGTVKHTQHDGLHTFNIHHGITENFSKFLAKTHEAMADNVHLKLQITHMDKNMVCMDIENPSNLESPY